MVLIDPAASRVLSDEAVLSRAGWTPYAGRQVRGAIVRVLLRGHTIARDARPSAERRGRYMPGPGLVQS